MAGKNCYLNYTRAGSPAKMAARFFSGEPTGISANSESLSDFNEEDVWNLHAGSPEIKYESGFRNSIRSSRNQKRSGIPAKMIPVKSSVSGDSNDRACSAPVNIPDWSKILKEEYRDCRRKKLGFVGDEEDYEDCEEDNRIPPHEMVAKQFARAQISSFSVHEGAGRTLKGRDLSRVRNAIWEKTGFED